MGGDPHSPRAAESAEVEGVSQRLRGGPEPTQNVLDREIEEKILRYLPGDWREKLAKQCAQKAHGKHWVKVLKPCSLNRARLEQSLVLADGTRQKNKTQNKCASAALNEICGGE